MREALASVYLDWLNNYLTVETFADHHHIEVEDAEVLIRLGRRFHEERTGLPPAPPGYTAEELERDNPYNQWFYEGETD